MAARIDDTSQLSNTPASQQSYYRQRAEFNPFDDPGVNPAAAHLSDQQNASQPGILREEPQDEADAVSQAPLGIRKRSGLRPFLHKVRRPSVISQNIQDVALRVEFILKLAKALLSYGAPSHRIESHLSFAADVLHFKADFVHLPSLIIVTIRSDETRTTSTHFVRAGGKVSLSKLHKVHLVYRAVLDDQVGASQGTQELRNILRSPPVYPIWVRCLLAFICASIMCGLSFGGSIIDIWISGACAATLQYLGLAMASKSAMYSNVYEISASILVSFIARALSSIRQQLFCYSAMSSAGVILILPGFTVLTSALELMSRNLFCGSVRIVYAVIYTLFLGFSLTIGSDLYLVLDPPARRTFYHPNKAKSFTFEHGTFHVISGNSTVGVPGLLGRTPVHKTATVIKGCLRDSTWPWYRLPFPWWTAFFLVPIYTTCSSLSNQQNFRSWQLPVMVFIACASYSATRGIGTVLKDRSDLVSAAGAIVVGILGNLYGRYFKDVTPFTTMVTGVLFLVPSSIAQGGGLTQAYKSSAEQYSSGFSLALRMIAVASGVTVGLFTAQLITTQGGESGDLTF